jgi:hypothetical protein
MRTGTCTSRLSLLVDKSPRDSKYISIYYSILPNFHVVGGYRPEDYNYKLYSIGRDLFVIIIITITDR